MLRIIKGNLIVVGRCVISENDRLLQSSHEGYHRRLICNKDIKGRKIFSEVQCIKSLYSYQISYLIFKIFWDSIDKVGPVPGRPSRRGFLISSVDKLKPCVITWQGSWRLSSTPSNINKSDCHPYKKENKIVKQDLLVIVVFIYLPHEPWLPRDEPRWGIFLRTTENDFRG